MGINYLTSQKAIQSTMVSATNDRTSKFSRLAKALVRSGYQDFYLGLAAELATILDVEFIIIAKIDGTNPSGSHYAQTIAAIGHNKALDNFTYALQGTPCETVPDREMCNYSEAVAQQFPTDLLLSELAVESYVGMPVLTASGSKLGLIAAMSTRPWTVSSEDREVLQIAAAQVGAELELANNRSHIQALTYEDSITGLPNALQLNDILARRNDISAVLLLDIRRFKDFNDLYGYREGDALLNAVAARLRSRLNDDELVTRFSNDEFAIALSSQHRSGLDSAQAVRGWFAEPLRCGERMLNVDVRLGLSQRDDTYQSATELLRQASIALAEAKRNDTPVVAYARNMVETLAYRQTIYDRLILALRNDHLRLHYQPVFDLDSGALFGAEALCRWHDPELGWIGPNIFIPVAEERGLMNELGLWVLRAAAKQLRLWQQQGLNFNGKLSVNISNRQLEPDDVIETFMDCLDDVTPSQLVLELTESSIMRAPEHNIRQINRLKDLGFRWALDDFGTGYSSLAYLTRLNVDVIKIDRSFIAKIPGNTNDELLIKTLVAMAKTMNMILVGEGIEQQQQLDMLRELGCHLGQGYHLGRPVCADEFAATWLNNS